MSFREILNSLRRRSVIAVYTKGHKIHVKKHHIQEIEKTKNGKFNIHLFDYMKEGKYYKRAVSLKNIPMMEVIQLYHEKFLRRVMESGETFTIQLKEGRL